MTTMTTMRPYQSAAISDAVSTVLAAIAGAGPRRRLYSAPTGTGKGTIQLAVLAELRARSIPATIVTPSLEVVRGYLARTHPGGPDWVSGATDASLWRAADALGVTTPTRLRNKLLRGGYAAPQVLVVDEAHHAVIGNTVTGDLSALCADAVWLGYTATPYRATPRETTSLREFWGVPSVILTITDAVRDGWMASPTARFVPLVDDDRIEIAANGEFSVSSTSAAYIGQIGRLAELVSSYRGSDGLYDVPTAVAVPSAEVRAALVAALPGAAVAISADTTTAERSAAYTACRERGVVIVSIAVIGEGVDLPWLRRLIDARPIISPVAWLQLLGRITRPGDVQPEYVATNRNLERHAYLMTGVWPSERLSAQTQDGFGGSSARGGQRILSVPGLSRMARTTLRIIGGGFAEVFNVGRPAPSGIGWEQVLVVLLPGVERPVAFRRLNPHRGEYGRWSRYEIPADGLAGWASGPSYPTLTDRQRLWWDRAARRYGLADASHEITSRAFAILPALTDTGMKLLAAEQKPETAPEPTPYETV